MKTLLFAAALMLGGAAYAQDTSGQTGSGMGGTTVAPGNQAPERDARGVPVISAPAEAPSGYNQPPSTSPAPPATSMPAAGPMPPCTRKVTDHCTQTYERHRSGGMTAGSGDMSGGTAATTDASGGDTGNGMADATTTTTTKKTTHHRRHRK